MKILLIYPYCQEERVHTEDIELHYRDARELLRELKALGAHNVNDARPPGLTGRARLQRFLAAYEELREQGVLPATYEVYYLVVRKQP